MTRVSTSTRHRKCTCPIATINIVRSRIQNCHQFNCLFHSKATIICTKNIVNLKSWQSASGPYITINGPMLNNMTTLRYWMCFWFPDLINIISGVASGIKRSNSFAYLFKSDGSTESNIWSMFVYVCASLSLSASFSPSMCIYPFKCRIGVYTSNLVYLIHLHSCASMEQQSKQVYSKHSKHSKHLSKSLI